MTAYTSTQTETFTIAHAKKIAANVASDLMRFHRLYGAPSDERIKNYEAEIVELLKLEALEEVTYGFRRNDKWTPAAVRYKALPGGDLMGNDDPGKIKPGIDIEGAVFGSYLEHNANWARLTEQQRHDVQTACGFTRGDSPTPGLEKGVWVSDHTYSAGGRGVERSTIRH
jgi:hypothetical protein